MGLKRSHIISRYTESVYKALEILGEQVKISETMIVQQIFIFRMRMKTSKQFHHKNLNSLILETGSQALRNPMTVNINEIYAAKIMGVDSHKSCVVCGILLKSNDVGSTIRRVKNSKVDVVPDLIYNAE